MTSFLVHPLAYALTEPPSWVILSAFSLVGLFVVFHRFWSLRNLDILLILAFIPGFMMVYEGQQEKHSSSIEVQRQDSTRDATDQNASEQIEPGQNLTGQNLPGQNQQRQTPANLNAASSSQPNANPTDPIALELSNEMRFVPKL